MPRVYEKADEATKKRLEEMRLKGLETRRMRSEIKKADKEQKKAELVKAYEERVLKRKQQAEQQAEQQATETPKPQAPQAPQAPPPPQEEETDKDIYNNARYAEEEHETETESEEEAPPPPPPKARTKKTTSKRTPKAYHQPTEPNYKQEYYRLKMMKLQEQDEHNRFVQSYERAPPSVHVADIARKQLKQKIDRELFNNVYNQLFPS